MVLEAGECICHRVVLLIAPILLTNVIRRRYATHVKFCYSDPWAEAARLPSIDRSAVPARENTPHCCITRSSPVRGPAYITPDPLPVGRVPSSGREALKKSGVAFRTGGTATRGGCTAVS